MRNRFGRWIFVLAVVLAMQCVALAEDADIYTSDPPSLPDTLLLKGVRAVSRPTDSLGRMSAAGTPCTVIRVKASDPRVRVKPIVAAPQFPGGDENFGSMISRTRPTIAVTGTYFSTRSLRPIGDIKVDGRLLYQGLMGTAMAIAHDGRPLIRRVSYGHAEDWSQYPQVLACGPALVLDGRAEVDPSREGFRDPHIMGSTYRIGVGFKADGEMLMVITQAPVSFQQWARVMAALGCTQAMNLDAGASMAVYYRGKTLMSPSRRLTNLLGVYVDDAAPPPRPQASHAPPAPSAPQASHAPPVPSAPQASHPPAPAAPQAQRAATSRVPEFSIALASGLTARTGGGRAGSIDCSFVRVTHKQFAAYVIAARSPGANPVGFSNMLDALLRKKASDVQCEPWVPARFGKHEGHVQRCFVTYDDGRTFAAYKCALSIGGIPFGALYMARSELAAPLRTVVGQQLATLALGKHGPAMSGLDFRGTRGAGQVPALDEAPLLEFKQ